MQVRCALVAPVVIALVGCVSEEETIRRRADAQSDGSARDSAAIDAQRETGPEASVTTDALAPIDVPIGPDPDRPDVMVIADRCAPREECNDRDDNCDGVVDEGCPRGVTVTMPPRFSTLSRGSASGNRAQGIAGRNEVIVGFYGRKGGVIDNLGPLVAPLTVVADTTRTPFTYAVRTGAVSELPAYGGSGGSGFREACPQDTILTTLQVVHRNGCTSPGICYEVLGDLIGQCSRVQVQLEGTAWTIQYTPVSELRVMGSDAMRSTYNAPPGPYAGAWMRTGSFVDELGLGQVEIQLDRR